MHAPEVEAEGLLRLASSNQARDADDVAVEGSSVGTRRGDESEGNMVMLPSQCNLPDVVEVGEDERLFPLETARDDVLGVLVRERVALLELQVGLEEELLVVCRWPSGHEVSFRGTRSALAKQRRAKTHQ